MAREFLITLKNIDSNINYYFWDNVNKYIDKLIIYTGNIPINKLCDDYPSIIGHIVNDILIKCNDNNYYLTIHHDTLNNNDVIHFFLIIDKNELLNFKKTLLFALSEIFDITQNLRNYKVRINWYIGYTCPTNSTLIKSYCL